MDTRDQGRKLGETRGGVLKAALFFAVFLAAALVLVWMILLPMAVRSEIERTTNFATEIDALSCNPFGATLKAEGITIENPIDFEGKSSLMEIESLAMATDLASLTDSSEMTIHQIELVLSRVTLVISERGELNLRRFCDLLEKAIAPKGRSIRFPDARLSVEIVEIVDLSSPRSARVAVQLDLEQDGYEANSVVELFRPLLRAIEARGNLPSVSARATL